MVTEDYVSFEVAKLLKEKGFDAKCSCYYFLNDEVRFEESLTHWDWNHGYICRYSAPTLQLVMKWLREVRNLVIEPYVTACGYLYTISRLPFGSTCYDNGSAYNGDDEDSGQWTTWEKACEDGIKYCLENLIQIMSNPYKDYYEALLRDDEWAGVDQDSARKKIKKVQEIASWNGCSEEEVIASMSEMGDQIMIDPKEKQQEVLYGVTKRRFDDW